MKRIIYKKRKIYFLYFFNCIVTDMPSAGMLIGDTEQERVKSRRKEQRERRYSLNHFFLGAIGVAFSGV